MERLAIASFKILRSEPTGLLSLSHLTTGTGFSAPLFFGKAQVLAIKWK